MYREQDLGFIGYERYVVNTEGEVRSPRGRVLKPNRNHCVGLSHKGEVELWTIPKLVALAFVPNPENLTYVRFKDGDWHNHKAENLYWSNSKRLKS
jgi:hypothetical protein